MVYNSVWPTRYGALPAVTTRPAFR